MIESLFGYTATGKTKNGAKKESSSQNSPKFIQIIDTKKAQNLSILLKALNVTTQEVSDALEEGLLPRSLSICKVILSLKVEFCSLAEWHFTGRYELLCSNY